MYPGEYRVGTYPGWYPCPTSPGPSPNPRKGACLHPAEDHSIRTYRSKQLLCSLFERPSIEHTGLFDFNFTLPGRPFHLHVRLKLLRTAHKKWKKGGFDLYVRLDPVKPGANTPCLRPHDVDHGRGRTGSSDPGHTGWKASWRRPLSRVGSLRPPRGGLATMTG